MVIKWLLSGYLFLGCWACLGLLEDALHLCHKIDKIWARSTHAWWLIYDQNTKTWNESLTCKYWTSKPMTSKINKFANIMGKSRAILNNNTSKCNPGHWCVRRAYTNGVEDELEESDVVQPNAWKRRACSYKLTSMLNKTRDWCVSLSYFRSDKSSWTHGRRGLRWGDRGWGGGYFTQKHSWDFRYNGDEGEPCGLTDSAPKAQLQHSHVDSAWWWSDSAGFASINVRSSSVSLFQTVPPHTEN